MKYSDTWRPQSCVGIKLFRKHSIRVLSSFVLSIQGVPLMDAYIQVISFSKLSYIFLRRFDLINDLFITIFFIWQPFYNSIKSKINGLTYHIHQVKWKHRCVHLRVGGYFNGWYSFHVSHNRVQWITSQVYMHCLLETLMLILVWYIINVDNDWDDLQWSFLSRNIA